MSAKLLLIPCVIALAATLSLAGAALDSDNVTIDFENVTIQDLEGAGWVFIDGSNATGTITIETSITHSGGGALRLNIDDLAVFPLHTYGTLEMWVYDFGNLISSTFPGVSCYGPVWGLQKGYPVAWTYPGSDNRQIYTYRSGIGAGLLHKSYLDSDFGFGYEYGETPSIIEVLHGQVDSAYQSGSDLPWTEQDILDLKDTPYLGWGYRQSWWASGWLGGGSPNNSELRVAGWNKFRFAYTRAGRVEVTLLLNADGTRGFEAGDSYMQHSFNAFDSGNTANLHSFDGSHGGGPERLIIWGGPTSSSIGEWEEGGVIMDKNWFGDVIVDDIVWTPQKFNVDFDDDGDVDIDDFIHFKQNYGKSPASWSDGDFDGNGKVDIYDFIILKQGYGI